MSVQGITTRGWPSFLCAHHDTLDPLALALALAMAVETGPRTDALAIFFIALSVLWTLLVAAGAAFLIVRRHIFVLRARGLWLSLASIALLHLYWLSVQLGYVLWPLYPENAEYWIMGTWLPCGVALFHASNSRFLHVARAQRRFAGEAEVKNEGKAKGVLARFKALEYNRKAVVLVGMGMALQILLVALMYILSRKWHPSWGIPGTELSGEHRGRDLGRGWEWYGLSPLLMYWR